ncbi:hypothetical protein HHI36_018224 [Cryptolaemus montrouzieri]|uniref:Uncharacterized protein n=1 Tax=Cryptolaemus montrouzieri TaxID=559131 RepID=A0ABD2NZR1_9CUCU
MDYPEIETKQELTEVEKNKTFMNQLIDKARAAWHQKASSGINEEKEPMNSACEMNITEIKTELLEEGIKSEENENFQNLFIGVEGNMIKSEFTSDVNIDDRKTDLPSPCIWKDLPEEEMPFRHEQIVSEDFSQNSICRYKVQKSQLSSVNAEHRVTIRISALMKRNLKLDKNMKTCQIDNKTLFPSSPWRSIYLRSTLPLGDYVIASLVMSTKEFYYYSILNCE